MKKSEELKVQASQEENDLIAFGIYAKAIREGRSEKFEEHYLPALKIKYPVESRINGSYTITTQDFGILDYFPKANKLLIREKNKWIKPGLKWIYNNLFN